MRISVSILTLLALTAPGFAAEAISYKGTLNGTPILVELTDPAGGPVAGRYSYVEHGVDIPLEAAEGAAGQIVLTEEAPCAPGLCPVDDDYNVTAWPVAATWTLSIAVDGSLTGSWQAQGKSKTLAIDLQKVGQRTLPDATDPTPYGLHDSAYALTFSRGAVFSAETAPYDFLKLDVPLQEGPVETLQGSHFRYVTDPRTKFAFPRILDLSDGGDITAANEELAAEHAGISLGAFDCLSQIYSGFGGRDDMLEMGIGTLAGYDDETVIMTYLSPTLTTWTESGSTFCAGAYPNNHSNVFMIDTGTGEPLALARVFKDWIAVTNTTDYAAPIDQAAALAAPQDYIWQAGQTLIDYVIANKTSEDAASDDDCGINDLIASNLGVRFLPGDTVVFDLEGLPHAILACGEDLLTVKLADIPELLAPTAAEVFPSLAKK
ncbi:MAG: hypothetical protein JWR51_4068 [Devosia sp.]|uniref:hypothetical protein n=1 Tax=Devosia sp. TaxID=1871048 RepID=UPI0026395596|nr:hypothetical protein [Devosia sp.]MDB5530965.1 hypothetical protein [Devosia sp.]